MSPRDRDNMRLAPAVAVEACCGTVVWVASVDSVGSEVGELALVLRPKFIDIGTALVNHDTDVTLSKLSPPR